MKIVDLFCGAGGFSKGFELAGFKSVLALDKWKDAIETYNFNRSEKIGENIDIYDYSNEEIKVLIEAHDIVGIIGGPPCQGYSMVGTRDTSDERNNLYLQYVRFTEQIKPKFFILENVKGLLTLHNGYFKNDIIERFGRLGYNVSYKVLKASEFGVPQNRERVFFVGLRKDVFNDYFFDFPFGNKESFVSNFEALSDLPNLDNDEDPTKYICPPNNRYQKIMREGSESITNNEKTNHTQATIKIISAVPDGSCIKDISVELYKVRNYNAAFKRMNSKLPSTTIDCGHRNYFHYSQNRIPTVRESARIQSFFDTYKFCGSKSSQYTQVGNAVPPLLSFVLAERILSLIKNL